ncbi:hypothetical protein M5J20_04910 [Corynebacterium sp. TA-R-1]|uniref:Glutaredoxin n=1 Tax=Corynebacterium stercoris TaxID=2943490 RepID=A0ABT1G486_9CORY|nr:hypothetical protein [Corynebacterium stercoris]MCP1387527.1 hypothetical protein [Corynebacterium stercoris]
MPEAARAEIRAEIFVHDQCPHCAGVIAGFKPEPGVELVNINGSLPALKRFLAYRDALDGYTEVKTAGKVGVPSKVIDGERVEFFDEV